MIESEDKKIQSTSQSESRTWNHQLLESTAEAIRIENHKLRALLYTFSPQVFPSLQMYSPSHHYLRRDQDVIAAIHPDFNRWRLQKIEHYIKLEIRRCGRNDQELTAVDEYNHEFKWEKLHDAEYISHISGDITSTDSPQSWDECVHGFTENLEIAQVESLEPADRWIHLLICSQYLMCARSSKDYRDSHNLFNHPLDTFITDTGFTLDHYIVELEVVSDNLLLFVALANYNQLLFGILSDLETEYLGTEELKERIKNRFSQPSTPLIPGTGRDSENSSHPTSSPSIDEYGVMFRWYIHHQ